MRSVSMISLALVAALPSPVAAVAPGQIDTFSTSAEGWFTGGGPGGVPATPAAVVGSGGPSGAGDAYMQLTSSGSSGGPGGRLVVNNAAQWAGNYVAAGVSAIEMDLRNQGSTDLAIRLLFQDPAGGATENTAATTFAASLPAGGGWTHVRFPIAPTDLTAIEGDATAALTGATYFRLYHGATADFPPDPLAASLGVDNISAVPEPASWVMFSFGLLGLMAIRPRSRSC